MAYAHNASPPPPPRGDFIRQPGLVKGFFCTIAKRRRAPKCPPLWRLRLTCHRQASYAAHGEGFECTFSLDSADHVSFFIWLDANDFRLEKLASFALTRAVFAFFEEAHAGDGGAEGELGEDCFHASKLSQTQNRTRTFLRFVKTIFVPTTPPIFRKMHFVHGPGTEGGSFSQSTTPHTTIPNSPPHFQKPRHDNLNIPKKNLKKNQTPIFHNLLFKLKTKGREISISVNPSNLR